MKDKSVVKSRRILNRVVNTYSCATRRRYYDILSCCDDLKSYYNQCKDQGFTGELLEKMSKLSEQLAGHVKIFHDYTEKRFMELDSPMYIVDDDGIYKYINNDGDEVFPESYGKKSDNHIMLKRHKLILSGIGQAIYDLHDAHIDMLAHDWMKLL